VRADYGQLFEEATFDFDGPVETPVVTGSTPRIPTHTPAAGGATVGRRSSVRLPKVEFQALPTVYKIPRVLANELGAKPRNPALPELARVTASRGVYYSFTTNGRDNDRPLVYAQEFEQIKGG